MLTNATKFLAVAALAAGTLMAQIPGEGRLGKMGRNRPGRVVRELNLTDAQKAQAKDIFKNAAQASKPLREQMREARKQLAADTRAGVPETVLSRHAEQIGALTSQMAVARAKTMQQFYSILTADQRSKLESLREQRRGGGRARRG